MSPSDATLLRYFENVKAVNFTSQIVKTACASPITCQFMVFTHFYPVAKDCFVNSQWEACPMHIFENLRESNQLCAPHYLKIPPIALDASTESTAIHQISSKPTVPQSPDMYTHMQSEQLRASTATHSF